MAEPLNADDLARLANYAHACVSSVNSSIIGGLVARAVAWIRTTQDRVAASKADADRWHERMVACENRRDEMRRERDAANVEAASHREEIREWEQRYDQLAGEVSWRIDAETLAAKERDEARAERDFHANRHAEFRGAFNTRTHEAAEWESKHAAAIRERDGYKVEHERMREERESFRLKAKEFLRERDEARAEVERLRAAYDSEAIRRDCLASFMGGYPTPQRIEIFQHGMETVCNVVRAIGERLATAAPAASEPTETTT